MKEGYKKTELGWIPEEWNNIKIGDIFELSGGLSVSREKLGNSGVCYLHYGDIHKRDKNYINVDIDKNWLPKIEGKFDQFKNSVKLEDGDIVFADASEDYEGIGKSVAILNENNKEFVSGLHTIVGKDINRVLDRNFKRFCLSTDTIRKQFRKFAVGTSVYGISRENLKKISVLVPPLEEQQKIAEILSTVDSQIDDTDKLIEKTKELKKGLMQRLLTKGIGHSEFKKSEVGEIPVEWEVKSLGQLFKLSSGEGLSQKDIVNGAYPVYGGNGISGYHNEYLFEDSKIVIGRVGAKCGCIHKSLKNAWITDNALYIKEKKVNYNDDYMVYLLEFLDLNRFANKNAQPVISGQKIYLINIGFPNLNEQNKIADILISVDSQISEYENKKLKLEELKKGLMQQLLTGKIRVV